jgi:hypothetical protein
MTWSACETVTEHSARIQAKNRNRPTLRGRVLDGDADDLAVVNDDSTSLEPGSTKECLGVKDESDGGTESSLVISD